MKVTRVMGLLSVKRISRSQLLLLPPPPGSLAANDSLRISGGEVVLVLGKGLQRGDKVAWHPVEFIELLWSLSETRDVPKQSRVVPLGEKAAKEIAYGAD